MRLQLALNVPNLEEAIVFYEQLFGVAVAKRKPGYANFEVAGPALKLVLFESDGPDRLNHLGVETFSDSAVVEAGAAMRERGLDVQMQEEEGCCFATQNKAVTYSPDGTMWEWYHKLGDLEGFADNTPSATAQPCCAG